jgi:DNA-binding NarL/FixJ family response regulator
MTLLEGTSPRLAGLSEREYEVLSAIAEGLSNDGIAARLFISVKTVEATCRAVFTKLDLATCGPLENRRVKAAAMFLRVDAAK